MIQIEVLVFYIIMMGLLFEAELVIWAERQLMKNDILLEPLESPQVKKMYWRGRIILIPLTILTIYAVSAIASSYPLFRLGIQLFGGVIAAAYIPMYRYLFGLFTGIYISNMNDSMILGKYPRTKQLIMQRFILFILLIGVALALALGPAVA